VPSAAGARVAGVALSVVEAVCGAKMARSQSSKVMSKPRMKCNKKGEPPDCSDCSPNGFPSGRYLVIHSARSSTAFLSAAADNPAVALIVAHAPTSEGVHAQALRAALAPCLLACNPLYQVCATFAILRRTPVFRSQTPPLRACGHKAAGDTTAHQLKPRH